MKVLYTLVLSMALCDASFGQTAITWTKATGVTVNGSALTKTAAGGWGNAGASSRNRLLQSTDGYLQYTVNSMSTTFAFGFTDVNVDNQFYTIDFGFQRTNGTLTYVRLHGTSAAHLPRLAERCVASRTFRHLHGL